MRERLTRRPRQNRRICRKTDQAILTILVWVYFLQVIILLPKMRSRRSSRNQVLDKIVLGLSAIFGLREDTHLDGNQYSIVAAMGPSAQLAWQPFSSMLIVKVPHRILMPAMVLGWGIVQICTPACHSFAGLLANRFFLGLFEAGCLPLFSVITSQWYRRSEQPMRVALWFGTNGVATMVAGALCYGLGHLQPGALAQWQWLVPSLYSPCLLLSGGRVDTEFGQGILGHRPPHHCHRSLHLLEVG